MSQSDGSFHGSFQTTRWSVVLEAKSGEGNDESWQESVQSLCEAYWYPLYAYLRRKGYSPEDCQDLVQSFFGSLIEKEFLKRVSPEKGRFRWFLMDALAKFAASWQKSQTAQKRGGGKSIVSIDIDTGESRYQIEPADHQTPEKIFERQWAIQVIEQAVENLETAYALDGKKKLFDQLRQYLVPDRHTPKYAETATELDLSETAIKVAIHRLRQKFTSAVHEVVLQTLNNPDELEEEVTSLLNSLG